MNVREHLHQAKWLRELGKAHPGQVEHMSSDALDINIVISRSHMHVGVQKVYMHISFQESCMCMYPGQKK